MTEPLSPAALAVLDAVASQMEGGWISPDFIPYEAKKIAAALRAAADQVRRTVAAGTPSTDWGEGWKQGAMDVANGLLAIAAELEALPE